jgi:N-acetylglucosamine kinase
MAYVLGIDGGATKTEAILISSDGRVIGVGRGGPSNYHAAGIEATRQGIAEAVAEAHAAAGVAAGPCAAAFLGLAGLVSPRDRAIIYALARELHLAPDDAIGIDHDCRIALAGGLSGRPGIVQIAGTGSSTFGVNAAGEAWRAGGWGQLLADEGSGYWFGLRAMQSAVGAYDGRLGDTILLDRIQDALQLKDMNDIMQRLYFDGMGKREIAALAPLVLDAARAGDRIARELVDEGMGHLAACVDAMARRLKMTGAPVEIALVGGLFQAENVVVESFRATVADYLGAFEVRTPELSPAAGAALLALDMAGAEASPAALRALRQRSTGEE